MEKEKIDSYFPDIEGNDTPGSSLSEEELQEGFYNPEFSEGEIIAPPKSEIPIEEEGLGLEFIESEEEISVAEAEKLKEILKKEEGK